jgi:hypothetical protein
MNALQRRFSTDSPNLAGKQSLSLESNHKRENSASELIDDYMELNA